MKHPIPMQPARYDEPLAPPWDVGRPQRAIYDLELAGEIGREVLDVGCGPGEHALFLAARGHAACGVDPSARAIARAQKRARELRLPVCFVVEDLLGLARLGRPFDCAIDAGTFHRIDIASRPAYAAALATTIRPGGRLHLLCFGDHERGPGGPRRISRDELRSVFSSFFRIDAIVDRRIES